MNSSHLNKWFAAILVALLLGQVAYLIGEKALLPEQLAKNVYVVEGVEQTATVGNKPAGPEPIEALLASANAEHGEQVAKKCLQCHGFEKGGANKLGPNLWGIVGAKIRHAADYAYSQALKAKEGSWGIKELNHLLWRPQDFARGTKMAFAGLSKAQDRADMVAYLNKQSDTPQDFSQLASSVEKPAE